MVTIKNAHGLEIDFDATVALMDHDISAELSHGDGYESEQAFFDAYCRRHLEVHGEAFEPAKENPVW